jgi:hypothetical protein
MKIFICSSKHFYHKIPPIRDELEKAGHELTMPNSYEHPMKEEELKQMDKDEHIRWKQKMMLNHEVKVKANDAILVLNFEKNGQPNYIGGATFLEMFKAFELGRKIFLYNPIPQSILTDEIVGCNPKVIDGDVSRIRP